MIPHDLHQLRFVMYLFSGSGLMFLFAAFLFAPCPNGWASNTLQNFSGETSQTDYILSRFGTGSGATVVNGELRMLNALSQNNVVAFPQTAARLYKQIIAEWDFKINTGADGFAFALLDTSLYGGNGAGPDLSYWEEPNLTHSFAVGFDIYNPDDIYRNGAREVSLHWDGMERANRFSSIEFRTGTLQHARVEITFVTGGAMVSVKIGDSVIYEDFFVAGMIPFESRVAFGARTGGISTTLYLDNINVDYRDETSDTEPPIILQTFNREYIYIDNRQPRQTFNFPDATESYERVIAKLTLSEPEGGYDHWDRSAAIYIWDNSGERYEIARYITPYRIGWTWWIDVTDYQWLMRGSKDVGLFIDTWVAVGNQYGTGWLVSLDFEFYRGSPQREAFSGQNLWVGQPLYGNREHPISEFFTPQQVTVNDEADEVKLVLTVTGHGQAPNSENAAEFLVRGRTVDLNGARYENTLWRSVCYLNPCRPQFGTWRYSRAGWCPGAVVDPWVIDITGNVYPGQVVTINYTADPYTNTYPGTDIWLANHWVESQIIYYRDVTISGINNWCLFD